MPIIDYERAAVQAEQCLLRSKEISLANKNQIKKFLTSYDVSPARKAIFLRHITKPLKDFENIKKDMKNRDKVNSIFKKYRDALSPSYYSTVVNVTLLFTKWLNDGEKPKAFRDLKRVAKLKQRRGLKAQDMITWDEGKSLVKYTTSVQLKSAILTQLDAGFRPSEFIDLNYGDVEDKNGVVVFHVNKGKTGARTCTCHRSAPYFMRWYNAHPTKSAKDPLWILEHASKSHTKSKEKTKKVKIDGKAFLIKRQGYKVLLKKIALLGEKAKIAKPLDFYNLRHSSCYLDKLDNLPVEIAAQRHGHSVKHFTEVYARLDTDDEANRVKRHYGDEEEKKKIAKNKLCERCNHVNSEQEEYCYQCNAPLTLKKALEDNQEFFKMKVMLNNLMARTSKGNWVELNELRKDRTTPKSPPP